MKIEYDILTTGTPVALSEAVRLHIAAGWEPVGGIAVSTLFERGQVYETWAQAVIRRAHSIEGSQP